MLLLVKLDKKNQNNGSQRDVLLESLRVNVYQEPIYNKDFSRESRILQKNGDFEER